VFASIGKTKHEEVISAESSSGLLTWLTVRILNHLRFVERRASVASWGATWATLEYLKNK
jgi:hypothetical protein